MYIAMSWMTATNLPKATAAVTDLTKHLRDEHGWRTRSAVGVTGPMNRVGVISFHDSLSQLVDRRAALAGDAKVAKKMEAGAAAMDPTSGTNYVLRVLHRGEEEAGGGRTLLYFRTITADGPMTGEMMTAGVQLAQHLIDVHGAHATVGSFVGGDGQGLLLGTSFDTGDEIEALGDALRGDDMVRKLSASIGEHASGFSDRIVRIID